MLYKYRLIGENGRLIADIIEITDILNKIFNNNGYWKSFRFIRLYFCHFCIEKYWFWWNLNLKQKSCVINGGNTTQYFHLESRAHQGGHILAYILSWLETINASKVSLFLSIFGYIQLMQMAQRFSLKTRNQWRNLWKHSLCFFFFLILKRYISKCEICVLVSLKEVEMTVCNMQSVDLTRDAIKILGIYFSYSMNLINKKHYCQAIANIHGILKSFYWS